MDVLNFVLLKPLYGDIKYDASHQVVHINLVGNFKLVYRCVHMLLLMCLTFTS